MAKSIRERLIEMSLQKLNEAPEKEEKNWTVPTEEPAPAEAPAEGGEAAQATDPAADAPAPDPGAGGDAGGAAGAAPAGGEAGGSEAEEEEPEEPEDEATGAEEEPPSSMVRADKALKDLKKAASAFIEKYGSGITDEKKAADIQKRMTELTFRKDGDEQALIKKTLKSDSELSSNINAISTLNLPGSVNEDYLIEMATIFPQDSGLPVAIWIDEGTTTTQHGDRFKFDPMNGDTNSTSWPSMLVSDSPQVPETHLRNIRTSAKDINTLKLFAKQIHAYKIKCQKARLVKKDYEDFIVKKKNGEI
jgi:hypothetical protein